MTSKKEIFEKLRKAAGNSFVSNRPEEIYLYSRDPGSVRSGQFSFLAAPQSVEDVCRIVKFAASEKIPIVPSGGGLSLSALTIPIEGGIIMDMRSLDKIIEVDEFNRYIVIEGGVTIGRLIGFLNSNHPDLRISVPDAPPSATMASNALIYGSGHLSQYGPHSEMINSLEVVLPSGDLLRTGSAILSSAWYGHAALPCLDGLFINWYGSTGIITKLSLKLFPRHNFRDVILYKVDDPRILPAAYERITATGLMEDILTFAMKDKYQNVPMTLLQLFITADTSQALDFKKQLFNNLFTGTSFERGKIVPIEKKLFPEKFIDDLMAEPKLGIEDVIDARKGGGMAYIGANLPMEKIPEAYTRGLAISERYDYTGPLYTIRNLGPGNSVIFTFLYPFNRADESSIDAMRSALDEACKLVYDLEGVLWKASAAEQEVLIKKMDRGTRSLIKGIKDIMDPGNILNPGNWDTKEYA